MYLTLLYLKYFVYCFTVFHSTSFHVAPVECTYIFFSSSENKLAQPLHFVKLNIINLHSAHSNQFVFGLDVSFWFLTETGQGMHNSQHALHGNQWREWMLNVNSILDLNVIVCVFEKWEILNSRRFSNSIIREWLLSMLLCVIT